MKILAAATLTALLLPAWAQAQAAQKLDLNFPNLAAKAQKKSELDLDGAALGLARQMAGQTANDAGKAAASASSGVTGVSVRHYEFAEVGAYSDRDLDPLRKQVAANPAWSRILNANEKGQSTQIFIMMPAAGQQGGFLVIAAELKAVTVVQILGTVELDSLQELVKSSISYDLKAAVAAKQ